jgi:hypothetical protein
MWTAAFECLGRLMQRKRHSLGNVFYIDRLYSRDPASKHWKFNALGAWLTAGQR